MARELAREEARAGCIEAQSAALEAIREESAIVEVAAAEGADSLITRSLTKIAGGYC